MARTFLLLSGAPAADDAAIAELFGKPSRVRRYESLPLEVRQLFAAFLRSLSKHSSPTVGEVAVLKSLEAGPVTVAIYEPQFTPEQPAAPTLLPLLPLGAELTPLNVEKGVALVTDDEHLISAIAGLFFGKDINNAGLFHSNNPRLMESVYFPVQLARDGQGVFFEERVCDRVKKLLQLDPNAEVLQVTDLGGWETVEELTASVRVSWRLAERTYDSTLFGTAVLSFPPATPESVCRAALVIREVFTDHGIPCVTLGAEAGVIYHRGVTPLRDGLRQANDQARLALLKQACLVAAFLDSRAWAGSPAPNAPLIELIVAEGDSDISGAETYIEMLGVDNEQVYWSKFLIPPNRLSHLLSRRDSAWRMLAHELTPGENEILQEQYAASVARFAGRSSSDGHSIPQHSTN